MVCRVCIPNSALEWLPEYRPGPLHCARAETYIWISYRHCATTVSPHIWIPYALLVWGPTRLKNLRLRYDAPYGSHMVGGIAGACGDHISRSRLSPGGVVRPPRVLVAGEGGKRPTEDPDVMHAHSDCEVETRQHKHPFKPILYFSSHLRRTRPQRSWGQLRVAGRGDATRGSSFAGWVLEEAAARRTLTLVGPSSSQSSSSTPL